MPVPPPDPEHDITRYQDVPDDDRLSPLALVKALKLRDQCLTLFKGHLAWNTDYLRACFLSGTLVDVNTQLFESWSGTHYNEPKEDVYVLELYKWIQGMIREHRIIHVRLPPVLPWGMVKTAISFVLVVSTGINFRSIDYVLIQPRIVRSQNKWKCLVLYMKVRAGFLSLFIIILSLLNF